ncbi:MAG: tetratricopeptide repeat protein [Desulfuromonadaceae bacterium]|nr:tetratricopeptide repeat protein [Desulfuromonadaceae bacterium]
MENGEYAEAEVCFLRTRAIAPDSVETILNLGYVLDMQGRTCEALTCYKSVLTVAPNNAKARYNRAIHLLRSGNLADGFADYEFRFAAMGNADSRIYSQPRWDGSPLDGRSILVYCEQGLGDALQFCRYLPYIARLGGRVILEVQLPLVSLFSGLACVDRVTVKSENPPHSDVHIPLLSLPHMFQSTLETLPRQVPYLMPPDSATSVWKEQVTRSGGMVQIGLVWAGKLHPYPTRSCPPENLEPLLALAGFRFYSLQVGEQDRYSLSQTFSSNIVDLTDQIRDFTDTAALILNLDLVITIDTAVAHLAGALGKPVWIMLPYATDWRWMLERSDSPWYPTARLFRQPDPGNWQSVVQEVAEALRLEFSPGEQEPAAVAALPETSFQQARAAMERNDHESAIKELHKVLLQQPDDPAVWFNLGRAYDLAEQGALAEQSYRQALQYYPDSPGIWFALGELRLKQRAYPEAEFCLRKAHGLKPESTEILMRLGKALAIQNKTQDALNCCQRVLGIRPDCAEATYNMALLQLRSGDYQSGFANFEARLRMQFFGADDRIYRQPRWDGSILNGRSILVYGEEGMGDVIQFSRYIPFLAELAGVVIFEVDLPLVPLFSGFPGVAKLVPKSAIPPVTDVYIQTLSLPFFFGTTFETVPVRIPYLVPDVSKVARWRQVLAEDTNYKIGLVWRGNPKNPRDILRSCPLATFSPLSEIPHLTFYSLQVGSGMEDVLSTPHGLNLVDHSHSLIDFTETAALIANLDLVIAVDTAVAHLAGAMGRPVWVLLPGDMDWRWLQGRCDTPWYPSMQLFCQNLTSGWSDVMQRIKSALEQWLSDQSDVSKQTDIEAAYEHACNLKEAGDLAGAEICFRRIVEQHPDLPDPQHSMGVVLQLQGRPVEAIGYFKAAIAEDPDFVQALYNLANALVQSGRPQEAIGSVREIIRLDPAHADAHWLLGMLLLLQGEYSEGWKEYEWRWQAERFLAGLPDLGRPLWDGSPLGGKTLLIQMEQGRGDILQFVRFAPLAAAKGCRVVVSAVPELVSLLSTADGVSQAVDQYEQLPDFDAYIPAMSLPLVLGITLESLPSQIPYLHPDPRLVEIFRRKMPADGLFRVGLVWQGATENRDNHNRSCALTEFLPLLELEGVVFYSLQIGDGSEQLKNLSGNIKVIDLTNHIHDFADTAALIDNLDLVISVCTSVAHLSGAIGKPVWTLLHFASDWRWLLERSDSPWYPSMTLIRQTAPGDWAGVIARVTQDLAQMLAHAGFHNQQGIALMLKGDPVRAELAFSYAVALNHSYAEAYCNRGAALHALDRIDEALDCYQSALQFQPNFPQALFNMGNSYRSLGRPDQAQTCYKQVLELKPDFVQAYIGLGEIAKGLRKFDQARIHYEKALSIDSLCVEALQGRAETCHAEEKFEDAISAYREVLTCQPDRADIWNLLGAVYHAQEKLAEAESCYRQALALLPDLVTALNNLGVVLNFQGRLSDAIAIFRHLLEVDSTYAEGHWNFSVALLAAGEYPEGWQEYEWRFLKPNPVETRNFPQPRWDGSALQGRTILLHAEQGFGDTLQFVRYARLVADTGGRVIIECQVPALKRLLQSLEGVAGIIVAGEPLPHFDCHLPLMSLPQVFGTTVDTIPNKMPYLGANRQDCEVWRKRIDSGGQFKVGLVWYAKQSQVLNRKRSCPLQYFSSLWRVQGVEFYSLQVDVGTEQLEDFSVHHKIHDLTGAIDDFSDTAACIANLDLVITIDTAVAHLAGALGARTWLILPYVAEWRWLSQREDSPWYPTMRLFRQASPGDWSSLMDSVATTLHEYIQTTGDGKIEDAKSPMLVGLAWAGRKDNPLDWRRSCPVSALAPLFNLPNIRLVKLQPDQSDDDTRDDIHIIDLTAHIHDFEDTAALMANLDLVLSIDTSVAHLAAATGCPTWVLLSHAAEWRWLTDREDSPWYPGMRLFRQSEHGNWDDLIQEVVSCLATYANNGSHDDILPASIESHGMSSQLTQILEHQLKEYQQNLCQDSNNPDALLNVGASLSLLGRYEEAATFFRRTIELSPRHVAGHLNLAYSLLSVGNYLEGWQHFEWRLQRIEMDNLPPWPLLQPNELRTHRVGTSVLVHCEQGFGDTIQFARFLPLLANAGYIVTVSCQPSMATLMKSVSGVSKVIVHGDLLPVCDVQILLLSLPWLFSISLELIPIDIPYLAPNTFKIGEWKKRLHNECIQS